MEVHLINWITMTGSERIGQLNIHFSYIKMCNLLHSINVTNYHHPIPAYKGMKIKFMSKTYCYSNLHLLFRSKKKTKKPPKKKKQKLHFLLNLHSLIIRVKFKVSMLINCNWTNKPSTNQARPQMERTVWKNLKLKILEI